jgi:5-methylthioadenosine/S-adenosylhomocysteine deaminase
VAPIHDPVAAVVLSADVSNVEHVLVDGEFRKRDFHLTGNLDKARTEVQNSRDRLVDAASKAKANA